MAMNDLWLRIFGGLLWKRVDIQMQLHGKLYITIEEALLPMCERGNMLSVVERRL